MNTENVSTLKIHKLTKKQYERELGAGRIDPTAIYLTPNEELLSIEQGGTGANNAADALVNLGAAPVEHLDDTNNPHGVTALQVGLGNVDNTSDMDKPVSKAQEEVLVSLAIGIGDHVADTNNPHGVTIEQIGAAPAGYGYGGAPILLSSTLLRSDVELEAVLEPIFSEIAAFGTKLIQFVGYPDNSDYSWFGILSKSSNNYGSLFAHSAYNKGQMMSKAKVGGTWQPTEWENPPMVLGVEYRTTERRNGKAVYRKALALGTLPVSTRSHYRWYIDKNATIIDVTMHAERRVTEGTTTNQDEQYNGNVFIEPADNTIMATATPWTNGNDWYMDIRTSKDLTYLVNTWGEMRYTKE